LIIHHYLDQKYRVYLKTKELNDLVFEIVERFLKDQNYYSTFFTEFNTRKKTLEAELTKLKSTNLKELKILELIEIYKKVYTAYSNFSLLQWLVFPFETYNIELPNRDQKHQSIDLNQQEKEELKGCLDLFLSIKKDSDLKNYLASNNISLLKNGLKLNFLDFYNQLQNQSQNFYWLSFRYIGGGFDFDYYLNLVRSFAINFDLFKRLSLAQENSSHKKLSNIQKLNSLLSQRRFVFYHFLALTKNLYLEISKRLNLNLTKIRYLYPQELYDFETSLSATKIFELTQRKTFSLEVSTKKEPKILVNKQAQKYLNKWEILGVKEFENKVFRGKILWGGQAVGQLSNKLTDQTIFLVEKSEKINLPKLLQTPILGLIIKDYKDEFLLVNIARIKQIPCLFLSGKLIDLPINQNYFLDGSHGKLVLL
jgi:hypothetical protein